MTNSDNIHIKYNSIGRFDKRADNYAKYRPDYPEELIVFLENELQLKNSMTIAEIGSGTGMFAKHILKKGYSIICVEPNKEMREYSSWLLSPFKNVRIINATAENTTLASKSVDLIFVAQSFHWFDFDKTKAEFHRILKSNGAIAICWILHNNQTEFEKDFEKLRKKFAISSYPVIRNDEEVLKNFFSPDTMKKKTFHFKSLLNLESLKGLLLSTSFIPQEGHSEYDNMLKSLSFLFQKHNIKEFVELNYHVPVYLNSK